MGCYEKRWVRGEHCEVRARGISSALQQTAPRSSLRATGFIREGGEPSLVLEAIRAHQSKHVHIVRRRDDERICWSEKVQEGVPLICGDCGQAWQWPEFPEKCTGCGAGLRRFALS